MLPDARARCDDHQPSLARAWRQRRLCGAALLLLSCLWHPVCLAQVSLQPTGTLYAVSGGTLTVYTTYTNWTGYWSSNLTLAAGADVLGTYWLAKWPNTPDRVASSAGQLVNDDNGLFWSPQQPIQLSLGPANASSVERIRETVHAGDPCRQRCHCLT